MNKSDNLTMYYPLSTAELKNTIGGNRSDFWEEFSNLETK